MTDPIQTAIDYIKYYVGFNKDWEGSDFDKALRALQERQGVDVPALCHNVDFGTYKNAVAVKAPWGKFVTLDICIIPEVKWLWDKGIKTINSCCGHGDKNLAYVAVGDEHRDQMDELGYLPHPEAPHCYVSKTTTPNTIAVTVKEEKRPPITQKTCCHVINSCDGVDDPVCVKCGVDTSSDTIAVKRGDLVEIVYALDKAFDALSAAKGDLKEVYPSVPANKNYAHDAMLICQNILQKTKPALAQED